VEQLDLDMTDAQCKECTAKIKQLADVRPLNVDDVYEFSFLPSFLPMYLLFFSIAKYSDSIIRQYHFNIKTGNDQPLLKGVDHPPPETQEAVDTGEPAAKRQRTKLDQDAAKCC